MNISQQTEVSKGPSILAYFNVLSYIILCLNE
jgi:hypothetical protein